MNHESHGYVLRMRKCSNCSVVCASIRKYIEIFHVRGDGIAIQFFTFDVVNSGLKSLAGNNFSCVMPMSIGKRENDDE